LVRHKGSGEVLAECAMDSKKTGSGLLNKSAGFSQSVPALAESESEEKFKPSGSPQLSQFLTRS